MANDILEIECKLWCDLSTIQTYLNLALASYLRQATIDARERTHDQTTHGLAPCLDIVSFSIQTFLQTRKNGNTPS